MAGIMREIFRERGNISHHYRCSCALPLSPAYRSPVRRALRSMSKGAQLLSPHFSKERERERGREAKLEFIAVTIALPIERFIIINNKRTI
jgi:hypothetical protein